MSQTPIILKRAALLVKRGWCQGAYARDAVGKDISSASNLAVRWCAVGAIRRAAVYEPQEIAKAVQSLAELLGLGCTSEPEEMEIVCWNDAPERTAAEVARTLRYAARLYDYQPKE
jgi:hypothetical protein